MAQAVAAWKLEGAMSSAEVMGRHRLLKMAKTRMLSSDAPET